MREEYRRQAVWGARRLVSRLDRRPWSPTYGCFDREYWHYRTLYEFPRADFQQAMWALALLYRTPYSGNEFAGQPAVLEWITAALDFWDRMRHPDGSVDEWYRQERSYCATAFTAAAVGETLLLLGEEIEARRAALLRASLARTVRWLAGQRQIVPANQLAAALIAADSLRKLGTAAEAAGWYGALRDRLLAQQHGEGWFAEHGGADLGYNLLTLDFLAHLASRGEDDALPPAIDRLLAFLEDVMPPDGTVAPECASRHTSHSFPYGLELLAARGHPGARRLLPAVREVIRAGRTATPLTADDTYAAYFYLTSFCLTVALVETPAEAGGREPPQEARTTVFPGARLVVCWTPQMFLLVDARGGGWYAADRAGGRWGDAGYVVAVRGGRAWGTRAGRGELSAVRETEEGCTLEVRIRFGALEVTRPLVRWVVPFKALTWLVLWIPALGRWAGRYLRRRFVLESARGPAEGTRRWHLTADGLEVLDRIRTRPRHDLHLYHAAEGGGAYSPSSLLYRADAITRPGRHLPAETTALRTSGVAERRYRVSLRL